MSIRERKPLPSVCMVIIQFHPLVGGAERQAQRLARELISRGCPVAVVTGRWGRSLPQRQVVDGIPVYRNTTLWDFVHGTFRYYAYQVSLAWYLIRNRRAYDIIHVHQALHAACIGTLMGKLLGKPVVVKVGCGGDMSDRRMMVEKRVSPFGPFFWRIIKSCNKIMATNREIEEELYKDGFSRSQVVLIPNGVGAEFECPGRNYKGSNPIRVLASGRLDHQKGFDVLLQALCCIRSPELACTIVGEGKERDTLCDMIQSLSLEQRVTLRGLVPDVLPVLGESDIFVLPSRAEGLSNSLLEAMRSGLPCIATDIGGNRDLLAPGLNEIRIKAGSFLITSNGILITREDREGLARALERLALDEGLRRDLGTRGRQWVERNCSLESTAGAYLDIYSGLSLKKEG